jgi:SulP family sulfate permease
MPKRIVIAGSALVSGAPRLAHALRERMARGYGRTDLRADVLAGLVVGIVALPLSMALSVASGAPPQNGLYTAVVAGTLIALLGGAPLQVSGPTAAFVVLLAPVASRHGMAGLLTATLLAGCLLIVMGYARLGRLIQFVPFPVVSGFTLGIAAVIALLQLMDLFGLLVSAMPEHTPERAVAIARALGTLRLPDVAVGALSFAVLLVWPRIDKRLPAPLVALAAGAVAGLLLGWLLPGAEVHTIASRFHYLEGGVEHAGIPRLPPLPALPWSAAGPGGGPLVMSLETLRELGGPAFAIALLGAIESLLSAVVADGMAGTTHDPDAELVAQGIGNVVAPFFGGFAATGAIARTATNVRSGARSPVAAVVHAIFVLAAMLLLAPWLGYLPMASLAALLLMVAWNMSDLRHVVHMVRIAPKSDVAVLVVCFTLTVVFDMVVSVSVGVMLAALLFMRRMAEVSTVELVSHAEGRSTVAMPPQVAHYRIQGPLFFGAAQKALGTFAQIGEHTKVVIFDMGDVPVIDATGAVNLESCIERLRRRRALSILLGVKEQPLVVLRKTELLGHSQVVLAATLEDALQCAHEFLDSRVPSAGPPSVASSGSR